jgi:hypothetical protein
MASGQPMTDLAPQAIAAGEVIYWMGCRLCLYSNDIDNHLPGDWKVIFLYHCNHRLSFKREQPHSHSHHCRGVACLFPRTRSRATCYTRSFPHGR